ncbi:L,D-transpeptidase family protein [Bowmanella dokdonensis]|uniref:YkuD domain-containing protein n=1 Tax=Bowmanella dokdonensis TaxID=751969 RepID=A0A939ISK2_9ALTE|nr:L,D-transpeptidase family protein [Bowmanella dokdonensis]MBN7827279.1 hypothetical protein [Bowmanella dokdonensis]
MNRWKCRFLAALLLTGSQSLFAQSEDWQLPGDVEQLVVVTTPDWQAIQGQLRTFERTEAGWQQAGIQSPVTIGRTGLAWGLGLHPIQEGRQKQEGDGKAPAGVFALTQAFGYEALKGLDMPYQQMQASHYCMDVKGSPYYNQIVDADKVGKEAVEGSSEGMRRDIHYGDSLYKQGVVVAHNPANVSGAGSCIFLHHWRGPDKPTAGCTAMPEDIMTQLLNWLVSEEAPAMVILPQDEYKRLQDHWRLPAL